ncbi:MAG: VWA domain-containing protein [Myxococcota bacterium]|jgi:Ca-activated chloride channel family protein|nr:VWA domain-containing protein [Myxococcota bacterium]
MTVWHLDDPWWLLALGLALLVTVLGIRRAGSARVRFPQVGAVLATGRTVGPIRRWLPLVLRVAALVLVVWTLARPQGGNKMIEVTTEGIDIVLTVDTSGSMEALDFTLDGEPATRLEVSKQVVADFIAARGNDRIGSVVFGIEAHTQCPMTTDYGILQMLVRDLHIGMAGDGTAIGDAIGISVQRLEELESKSRIVILLTDGRNNQGLLEPAQAAAIARTKGIKIYTIGVGTKGEAPFRVKGLIGHRIVYKPVDLDEATLNMIAETTGGAYFRATDTDALQRVYETIDELEKTKIETVEHVDYHETWAGYLAAALALLLTEVVLVNTRLRKVP